MPYHNQGRGGNWNRERRGPGGQRRGGGGGGFPRQEAPKPTFIPAPYNFAPVSDTVVATPAKDPPWADVPFSDGLSGNIRLTITAKTPIFIRGPGVEPDNKAAQSPYHTFYRFPDGRFGIPGTSVKGMLRNVLEIATFSRMNHIDGKKRYGFRDLNNPDKAFYGGWMSTTIKGAFAPKARAGWLSRDPDGHWMLRPCEFARIDHSILEAVSPRTPFGERKTAKQRYTAWCVGGGKSLEVDFTASAPAPHGHSCGSLYYAEVTSLGRTPGSRSGVLVFTGQPMDRDARYGKRVPRRKHMEFVFFDDPSPKYGKDPVPVPDEVMDDFRFIHEDSDDWKWWQDKTKNGTKGSIPVFYLAFDGEPAHDKDTAVFQPGKTLHSMGLALMYRLAHHKRIGDALPPTHRQPPAEDELPIAEAIFGTVEGDAALRGRVSIEPFRIRGTPMELETKTEVLNSPKPTFYPNYIEQQTDASGDRLAGGAQYATFQDADPRIRGWKRYPVAADGTAPKRNPSPNNNQAVCTHFKPLDKGSTFEGNLHFHNLRPWELGAVLWAITFGEPDNKTLRHSLGMAKPLGYGSVQVEINGIAAVNHLNEKREVQTRELIGKFRDEMARLTPDWELNEAIHELKVMAGQRQPAGTQRLRYPGGVKEFAAFKNAHLVLPRFSRLVADRSGGEPDIPEPIGPAPSTTASPQSSSARPLDAG